MLSRCLLLRAGRLVRDDAHGGRRRQAGGRRCARLGLRGFHELARRSARCFVGRVRRLRGGIDDGFPRRHDRLAAERRARDEAFDDRLRIALRLLQLVLRRLHVGAAHAGSDFVHVLPIGLRALRVRLHAGVLNGEELLNIADGEALADEFLLLRESGPQCANVQFDLFFEALNRLSGESEGGIQAGPLGREKGFWRKTAHAGLH